MTGDEVVIVGRSFTSGSVYASRWSRSGRYRPRRLMTYDEDSLLPGGRVTLALVPSGNQRTVTGEQWTGWAGEEVRP